MNDDLRTDVENLRQAMTKAAVRDICGGAEMKTIWKYEIPVEDRFVVKLPKGAKILTVQTQHETPCIWVIVDPNEKARESYGFRMLGTGHPFVSQEIGDYIGTYQLHDGDLVFHLFGSRGK